MVRTFFSLVTAAESLGIRYRKFEGPGAFITRLQSAEAMPSENKDIAERILILLNSVFYAPTALPGKDLQELLHSMKQMGKCLQSHEHHAMINKT